MRKVDDIVLTWTELRRWFLVSAAAAFLTGWAIGSLRRPPSDGERLSPAIVAPAVIPCLRPGPIIQYGRVL